MNRRLYKLENKDISKIMLLITGFVAIYSAISVICSAISNGASTDRAFIMKTVLTIISALFIVCAAIMMVKRYYNILFTDEGLVSFSFPVKNHVHLQTNLKCAFMWTGIMIVIFFAGLGISDAVTARKVERWGVGNAYSDLIETYEMNSLSAPGLKTVMTIIIFIIAFAVIAVNTYISFIFTLTLASCICGKYSILQKKGVIFLTGIVMYYIHVLIVDLFNRIEIMCGESFFMTGKGYDIFGPDACLISQIDRPVVNILFYGVTAVIMYRISKNILDKKLDI